MNRPTRTWLGLTGLVLVGVVVNLTTVASAAPFDQAATPTPAPCVTTPGGIQLTVENPPPGGTIFSGQSLIINGIGYDPASTSGPGIDSVTAYLGSRDAGGTFLGTATLGQPNPAAASGSPQANAGWTLRTSTLPAGAGSKSLFVYAHSSVSNQEASVEIPVYLNAAPTAVRGQVPTPVLPPPPACTPTPAPTVPATPTPTSPPAPAAPAAPTAQPLFTPAPTSTSVVSLLPTLPPIAPIAPVATPTPITSTTTTTTTTTTSATSSTAPRGGGIPSELGLALLALGAAVTSGGYALRRRERRAAPPAE